MTEKISFFISKFEELLQSPPEPGRFFTPRAYRNTAVRFRANTSHTCDEAKNLFGTSACPLHSVKARAELVAHIGLNPFFYPAHLLPGCDLLSDSGTTTMTMEQWSQLLLGDEAYGSNEGYYQLNEQFGITFGEPWRQDLNQPTQTLFIFHQGRAAEHALFSTLARHLAIENIPPLATLLKKHSDPTRLLARINAAIARLKHKTNRRPEPCYLIPSNGHFDTTAANIEDSNFVALNLNCPEHKNNDENFPFRGNIDLEDLRTLLDTLPDRIPLVYLTITNNTGGGQPVSMANIRAVHSLTAEHNIPLFFDACRFAENAWFIRKREPGYENKTIPEIVREMFQYIDGFHISLKKDGLVNIGGALLIRRDGLFARLYPEILEKLTDYQILVEGHPTYGGLAGRDLKALVEGLRTVVTPEYLESRIGQVQRFAERLSRDGIPVLKPAGGHAVYIDIDRFFPDARDEEYLGIAFVSLLLIAGHRLCELGVYAFELEDTPPPRNNFVRAAVPRLTYEDQDLFATAEAIKLLYEHRDSIPGAEVVFGKELSLRHFKSRFRFK
ncbi:MAG: tryptophanase [bacterium]